MITKKGWFGAWSLLAIVCYLVAPLSAQTTGTSGNFTYSDDGIAITITGYPKDAVGDVAIPSTINDKPVTSIGGFAFSDCTGLASVSIPPSVTSIGERAFYGCTGLTSVSIFPGVTSIGVQAFYGCTGLTSVSIPSSVSSIGDHAFYGCFALTSVSIPSSVTSIGDRAFYYCPSLVSFAVAAANPNYSSSDGVLFNKLQTSLIQCPARKSGAYTIPASVTSIVSDAFSDCATLTSVSIPSSVTTIGSYAFIGCTGLTSVSIPSSVTSIENYTFASCAGLTSVSIPPSVTNIGSFAFYYCTKLTSVSIPSSVTSIGSYAFQHCTGLTSFTVDAANLNYSSSDGVLFNKLQTSLIQCPAGKSGAYTIPSSVTSFGGYAFFGCTGLASVSIPSSVTSIGSYEFFGCTGLTSFSVDAANPNYSSSDGVLFNKLRTSLIRYPGGKSGAYTIPSSVTTIASDAFLDCTALVSLSVDATNPNYSSLGDVLFNKLQTSLIKCPAGKSGTYTIPSSVTTIASDAFSDCTALTDVLIPSSVTSINLFAFHNIRGLVSFSVDAANPNYSSLDDVLFNKLQTSLIKCPAGKSGTYTIPSSVTTIESFAFLRCTGLTSVSIPSSVTTIEHHAFLGCTELARAIFTGNAPYLGFSAFQNMASGFTVYYLESSSGFTSPTWRGYPAQGILAQTITFGPLSDKTYGDAPFTLSATASSGLTPTFSIFSGPATISGDTVTLTGAGTVTVRASQAGSAGYLAAATVDQSFIVITALQSWRQIHFGTTDNTGNAADNAVSNLDGLPNLIEYALGGTPSVANNAIPPKLGTVIIDDETYLTLTFTPQRPEITYTIEVTGDLTGAWTSIPLAGLLTMGQAYTYTDTIEVATGAPRFIRLSVSGQ